MNSDKLYAERDAMDLEPHYTRHVTAVTAEGLHSKAAIATELAWRDAEIERLRKEVESLEGALNHPNSPSHSCMFKDKLAQLTLEKDAAESKCAEYRHHLEKMLDELVFARRFAGLHHLYCNYCEHCLSDSEMAHEPDCVVGLADKFFDSSTAGRNYVPAEKLKLVEELLEDGLQFPYGTTLKTNVEQALTQLRVLKGGKE